MLEYFSTFLFLCNHLKCMKKKNSCCRGSSLLPNTPWFVEGLALHPMPTGPGHIILNLGPDTWWATGYQVSLVSVSWSGLHKILDADGKLSNSTRILNATVTKYQNCKNPKKIFVCVSEHCRSFWTKNLF